ncbi:restriction endonuclease subunit S [Parageobacillus thermoglucosidasius]|uniref:restriction endonuclease subunit S n=1 Tax=Parageobacillus thermoglucosidasius TaxID=1426 RepID=UPI000E178CB9|nr:restriction endonuclease subunit S [Parageobacillus thermoglucosidasius]RDE34148.1 restriction endonuclease subunit S [Parageobacillus thermoglucosidasius]
MNNQFVKLGEVCDFQGGSQPPKSEHIYEKKPGYIRFIQIRDFESDDYLTFIPIDRKNKICQEDDVLIARYGASIGKILTGLSGAYNVALIKCIPDEKRLKKRFLYYYLNTSKIQKFIQLRSKRSAQEGVDPKELKQQLIYLPSLEAQNRIVYVLDKAQELINKRKAQIEALDQLTQSVFLEMFGDLRTNQKGWKIVELSEVVQVDANLVDDITNYVNYPLVGIDNIEKNTGNLINIKTVGESDVKGSKYFFSREHILYSKIRPYLNKVASPSFEGLCSTDAYPLKINKEKANKQFILNILRSKDFVSYAVKHSKGANIPRIDQKQLLNYKTILPDLNTQNQFENIVKKIEIQKEIIKKSLRELENTFNSLMQRAFKGELFNN